MMADLLGRRVSHDSVRQRVPRWQRLLVLSYVTLLALVFPFICWGAWAEAGHPHAGPHFVFAVPPEPGQTVAELVWSLRSNCGDPRLERPGVEEKQIQTPAGQSLPNSTLGIVTFLVFLDDWSLSVQQPVQHEQNIVDIGLSTYTPLVSTPPPRSI